MEEERILLSYNQVIENIENHENHLIIGNGFNYGLGINTGYFAIFQRMIENNQGVYKDALPMVLEGEFDLEKFIGRLEDDINQNNLFLKKFVRNKVKLDFMQATHEIVKSEIKTVYAEKNEGIFLLLQNFTNYFSLNYDSFLYLLLLKYKSINNDQNNAIVFQSSMKFIEDDLNIRQSNIFREIKEAREKGELEINFGDNGNILTKPFRKLKKNHFLTEVNEYSKANNKGWKTKDINRVINSIFEEEQRNRILQKVDDGSRQLSLFGRDPEFVFDVNSVSQNLFFLHGAFHIYKDGHSIKKITQQSDKSLYDRLESILNNDEQDIVCVFQNENKTDEINGNEYLSKCLLKLGELNGNLVVIGCSLSDNDDHIFEQVNNSAIESVYVSTLSKNKDEYLKKAISKFPSKQIYLFDAESISYELPNDL
jgi:hypothetical protein